MIMNSRHGVCYFQISDLEKELLPKAYFDNKTSFLSTDGQELWVYNFEFPQLLTYGETVFGVNVKRDFYSEVKEEIFEELGLIEREEGIFSLDLVVGKAITFSPSGHGSLVTKGMVYLGDKVYEKKIKQLSGYYDLDTGVWEGIYGF